MRRKHTENQTSGKQNGSKRFRKINQWLRLGSQVIFFFLMPSLYISAYFGIIDLAIDLRDGTFTFAGSFPDLVPLLSVVTVTLLAGRYFCGWMCAFGSFGEVFYRISSRMMKRRVRVKPNVDRVLRGAKYILLAGLILVAVLGVTVSTISPWDVFALVLTTGRIPDPSMIFPALLPAVVILLLIIVASIWIERFFCRYLCPIGAVFSAVSRFSLLRLEKPREDCGSCKACTTACGMGIDLRKSDVVRDGACIRCMKCVDICPRQNIKVRAYRRSIKPLIAVVIAILLIFGLSAAGNTLADRIAANEDVNAVITVEIQSAPSTTSPSNETTLPSVETADATTSTAPTDTQGSTAATTTVAGQYVDGTYRGTGSGFRGDITVDVLVEGGKITSITVVSSDDDRKYFDRAIDSILGDIYNAQTTEVDVVSGATYSSEGILQAVENAIASARVSG